MSHDLRPGSEPVPGYTLVERLGRGGFGEVWKATGPGGFQVALKFVSLEEGAGPVELRALEVIKPIRHPHLLGTFGSWQVGDRLIIAMELADRTLLDRLREAAGQGFPGIPAPEVFEHFLDAAKALDYLNEPRHPSGGDAPLGIQHRDVKPQNLLLLGGSVKVADFGLARVLENSTTGHTGSMTPSYAAPEFFDRKTSSQSDQYSLAVTYCHLRGGRLPFEGNAAAVMAGHVMREPDLSMLPEAERPAVARALSKAPRDRWPSCRTFVQAVIDSAGGRPAHSGVAMVDAPPTTDPMEFTFEATEPAGDPAPDPGLAPPRRRKRSAYLLGAWALAAVGLLILAPVILLMTARPVPLVVISARTPKPLPSPQAEPRMLIRAGESPPPIAAAPAPSPPRDPAASRSHVEKGLAFLGKEANEPAIAEFDEAIRLDPTSALAFAGRAFARALMGASRGRAPGNRAQTKQELIDARRQQAEDDCDQALRLDPRLPLAHSARGLMLTLGRSPEFTKALAACDEAIRLDPGSPLAFLAKADVLVRRAFQDNRGSAETRGADLNAATKTAGRAISLDAKLVAAYYLRGNARRMNGNEDGALQDYEEARKVDADNPLGYFYAGLAWQAKGEHEKAIRNFSMAITRDPISIAAYNKRAEEYDAVGDKPKAEADRKEAARIIGQSRH